nr:hypothetical protein [Lachnospiraceae bacterium]
MTDNPLLLEKNMILYLRFYKRKAEYMFRLWAKIFKDTKMLKDMVVENSDESLNRTKKIFAAIDTVCKEFDL